MLLTERADKLESLAQALLAKEVLNENDLREVLGPRPYKRAEHIPGVTAEGEQAAGTVVPKDTPAGPLPDEPPTLGGDGATTDNPVADTPKEP